MKLMKWIFFIIVYEHKGKAIITIVPHEKAYKTLVQNGEGAYLRVNMSGKISIILNSAKLEGNQM